MRHLEILPLNEGIEYHKKRKIPLHESIFRMGSDAYFDMFKKARQQYNEGSLTDLHWFDEEILRDTQLGEWEYVEGVGNVPLDMLIDEENHKAFLGEKKKNCGCGQDPCVTHGVQKEAEYQGKKVDLNKPKRGGTKKFYVYTKNKKGNVVKVSFGAKDGGGNLAVKLKDPKARASFAARHDCENKKDKTKAGYWACRLPRYAKSLGLSGGGTWW
ncbi:hypothetical protein N9Z41_01540 [bacterium]|nr:hypothetical protein [bacterium]